MTIATTSTPLRTVQIKTPDELVDMFQNLNVVDRHEIDQLADDIRALEVKIDRQAADRLHIVISQYGFQAALISSSTASRRRWDMVAGHQFFLRMPAAADANTIGCILNTDAADRLEAIKMNLMALNMLTHRGHSMSSPSIRKLIKAIDEAALGFVRRLAKPS